MSLGTDERVANMRCDADRLIADLMNGRTIATTFAWYPRLLAVIPDQRPAGCASARRRGDAATRRRFHFPDMDEDLSTESLLRGTPAA